MQKLGAFVLVAVVLLVIVGGGAYYLAGRAPGPEIEVLRPSTAVGLETTLEMTIAAPGGRLGTVEAYLEQDGQRFPIFSLARPEEAAVSQEDETRVRIARTFERSTFPALNPGEGRLVVEATRPVLFGLRQARSSVARDLRLRFEPPRLRVLSTHHFVNHGGAEMVVYSVTPDDVESGVRVGELGYPGYAASGAGVSDASASTHVAFFALTHEQDLNTPIEVYAEDEAGNRGSVSLDHRAFPRSFRRSRLTVSDRFFERVVPSILERTPELSVDTSGERGLVEGYLAVNGELRRMNAETIASFADDTAPEILWNGAFRQLGNSQVESGFADHRTYLYEGEEIDQQVHLGFDLASTAQAPIEAANRGRVVFADYLGIYGNCVIIDHGMGVQSLYAHMSSIDVAVGQMVERNETLGRSGQTGLAGGDHLHFAMLVHGRAVNPVEWWDPHWIEDRIARKLRAASGS